MAGPLSEPGHLAPGAEPEDLSKQLELYVEKNKMCRDWVWAGPKPEEDQQAIASQDTFCHEQHQT